MLGWIRAAVPCRDSFPLAAGAKNHSRSDQGISLGRNHLAVSTLSAPSQPKRIRAAKNRCESWCSYLMRGLLD